MWVGNGYELLYKIRKGCTFSVSSTLICKHISGGAPQIFIGNAHHILPCELMGTAAIPSIYLVFLTKQHSRDTRIRFIHCWVCFPFVPIVFPLPLHVYHCHFTSTGAINKPRSTDGCRYNALQYSMILHRALQTVRQNINKNLLSHKTPNISPSRASYFQSVV